MPGNPKRYELEAAVEKAGGWDTVIAALEEGGTIRSIAKRFNVSRSFFHLVMSRDDARMERVRKAYLVRAEAHVDEALEIVDNAPETRDGLTKAKMQVEFRQWMAGNDNARFRKQAAGIALNISVGDLHLVALKHRAAQPALTAPAPSLPIIEAEVVEEGEPEHTHD